uniref:40S ribosomal protein S6 n=1 Tax=Chloropicon laureae TaxID=464258 RepID=A0A7S2Z203_9CHLO|mmetsp:Transcript_2201/g.5547  ORF Transcript_2201/g.5547 Transcript_2201/m.5547 type:complete len:243 (+) Transcript_2201:32-760(+)
MKINVANPATGAQKQFKVEEDNKLRAFYDKRLAAEVPGDVLGDEWKGYILKIAGGNDKDGFGMKQGCLIPGRAKILMAPGDQCFRGYGRRVGERRRKGVRGCIVTPDLAVLNLVITKSGPGPIPGLTDRELPKLRGPKRASKIRKLFALTKEDDVRKYVNIYRKTVEKNGKTYSTAPKIQRLITPTKLQRKRRVKTLKQKKIAKAKSAAAEYQKLLALRLKEAKERRSESLAKRRAASNASN